MKNDDLISRKALLAAYDAAHVGPPGGARKLMVEAPAVDAAPVVHGRWLIGPACVRCSSCRLTFNSGMDYANYCPNCGTKMDEEEEK